jgi:hypothetical protein
VKIWPFGPAALEHAAAGAGGAAPPPREETKSSSKAWYESAYDGVKEKLQGAKSFATDTQEVAKSLLKVLSEIEDPPKVVDRFIARLPAAVPFADKKADA